MSEKVNLEILCEFQLPQNKATTLMDLIHKIKLGKPPSFISKEGRWIIEGVDSKKLNEELIKQIEDFEVTVFVTKRGVRFKVSDLLKKLLHSKIVSV